MRKLFWLLSLSAVNLFAQTMPQPLLVGNQFNITGPTQVQDNRSQTARFCDYHSFAVVTGSTPFSVQMEYSDVSASGPWTQFGPGSVVTNSSSPWVGYGFGYHSWIRFNTTSGTTAVNYSCSKNYYLPSGAPAPNFTGLVYATGGAFQAATVPNIFTLFTGCSGSDYPGFDGVCHSGGGGGGGSSTALQVTVNGAVMTIGADCSVLNPCNVNFGSTQYVFTAPGIANLTSGSGPVYVYVDTTGVLTVGYNLALTSCSSVCTATSGIVALPTGVLPLATVTATSGVWGTPTDLRPDFFMYSPATSNVLAYGADPTYTTTSDTAFVNAMAATPTGGSIVIPPGHYKLQHPG